MTSLYFEIHRTVIDGIVSENNDSDKSQKGLPGFYCRMFNTEGGKTVHYALEECIKNCATELKLQGSEKKRRS